MTLEEVTRANLTRLGATPDQVDQVLKDFVEEFGPAPLKHKLTERELEQIDLGTVAILHQVLTASDPKAKCLELQQSAERHIRARDTRN